jgi:acetyl esterase/lipase
LLILRGILLLPLLAFGRTPFERLEEKHLVAVHEQRIEWMKKRAVLEPLGVYQDYRAIFTSESATRANLARSAKEADVQIVFSDLEPGVEDHVLFLKLPTQDFQGIDLPHHISPDNPDKWRKAAHKQKDYLDEVFGAATEAPPESLARWDQATSTQSVTGFATASVADDGISSRTIAFRNTITHILANQFTPEDILESLKQGHAYVAHDWLCDSTGFRFFADNNIGVFEMGDTVGTGLIAGATKITANVSVPAQLKLIRNGVTVLEATDTKLEYTVQEEGAYRLEAWLNVDGEARPWIFSNPLYVRKPWDIRLPSAETPPGVEVHRDITYTSGEARDEGKHKLDLFIPAGKPHVPVLVFLHGGSWMTGDRSLYVALGNRLARAGIAVAIPSYRLMPRNPHPAQMEDSAAAFDWVYRHIEQYGGDPKRIYVSGHSSGGHLAALLGLDESYLKPYGLSPADIRGVISMSGVYDVRYIPAFRVEGDRKDASPLFRVHGGAPRFLISYCQWDYLALPKQARDFAAALKKVFVETKLLYIPRDNHITEIINVTKEDGPLVNAILSFVD